jgi:integrase
MSLRIVDFFGLPVTFRVEARKNTAAVILSLRSHDKERIDGNGAIVYEHPPRIVRFTDEVSVEKRVLELIPECLQRVFDPATKEGRALRKKFAQRLPLAAVIAADFDRVAQSMKWANSTQKEHKRSLDLLVSKLGRVPFCEITQERFAFHLREGGFSDYQISGQICALRALIAYEQAYHLISEHFMDTFAMGSRRAVVGPRDTKKHFEKNILTHAQVGEIVATCAENLESSRGYLYFGLILMLITGITIGELCALTWGSFSFSKTYAGIIVVEIMAETKPAGEVYHTEELNGPRRRTIPLSPTMAKLYHKVKTNAPNVQENAPFMRSFKNAARRMRPDEFDRWLKGFFKSFDFSKQTELKSLTKNSERTLRATFRSTLESCGCDAEEIRYLCGNAPESVFARNYCAYDDPRELAKLAAVVEHYIFSLMSASDTALDFKINRSGEDYAIAAAPGSRISGDLTVDLSKISHDNLEAGRDLIIEFKSSDSVFVTTELDLEEN